jgi:hypothetical protein
MQVVILLGTMVAFDLPSVDVWLCDFIFIAHNIKIHIDSYLKFKEKCVSI